MANCKVCGSPKRTIPAGVSKATGKPYSAFEACPNRCKEPREDKPDSNEGMRIVGEMLADIQVKVNAMYDILNKEMPQE